MVVGERMRRASPGNNYGFSPRIPSTYATLGTILGAGMEPLTRQTRPSHQEADILGRCRRQGVAE